MLEVLFKFLGENLFESGKYNLINFELNALFLEHTHLEHVHNAWCTKIGTYDDMNTRSWICVTKVYSESRR